MEEQNRPTIEEVEQLPPPDAIPLLEQNLPEAVRMHVIMRVGPYYINTSRIDKLPPLLDEAIAYGKKTGDQYILGNAYRIYGWYYNETSDYDKAIEAFQTGRKCAKAGNIMNLEQRVLQGLSIVFSSLGLYNQALEIEKDVYKWYSDNNLLSFNEPMNLAVAYSNVGKFEQALEYSEKALQLADETGSTTAKLMLLCNLAADNLHLGRYGESLKCAKEVEHWAVEHGDDFHLNRSYELLTALYVLKQQWKDALHYGEQAYQYFSELSLVSNLASLTDRLMQAAANLKMHEKAYSYARQYIELQEKLGDEDGKIKAQSFQYQINLERKEKEFEVRLANARLQTLSKVAAKVAHEVQNPLQFVNNFSEVNTELAEDLLESKGLTDEQKAIINDIVTNADIVKDNGIRISKIVDQLLEQTRKAGTGD